MYADEILALDTIQDEIATSSDMKVILHTEESKTDALKDLLKKRICTCFKRCLYQFS